MCGLLLAAAIVDIRMRTIPNRLVAGLVGLWVIKAIAIGSQAPDAAFSFIGSGLLGAVGIAGILLCVTLVFERITQTAALGGGDIKLIFAVSLFLGPVNGLVALFLACLGGIVTAVLYRSRKFPFGPAIAASSCFMLLAL